MYTLRPPHADDADELEAVIGFVLPLQAQPDTRCLHLDWTAAGLRADLQDLDEPFEKAFRLVTDGDEIVGVLGCDIDAEAGRAWLHGPFAAERDWKNIVTQLFEELWGRLPSSINRVSNYLENAYQKGLSFHYDFGFVPKGQSHIYRAGRRAVAMPEGVKALLPSDSEMLCALHERAFPQSWLSGPEMIARNDARQPVLIAWEDGRRAGYIRLSRHVSLSEGSIDFVAVEPDLRGKGLGRRLLQAGLHWIFAQQELETAFLNVSDSNTNARALYESAGFELFQSGVALDWWRP